MSQSLQDEFAFYSLMIPSCYQPGHKHAWDLATSRWDSREPLCNNLANNYAGFQFLCARNRPKGGSWGKRYDFLMKPTTYFQVHLLADVLTIWKIGSKTTQGEDALKNAAVDVPLRLNVVREQLRGYMFAQPTEDQMLGEVHEGEPPQTSIVKRAFVERRLSTQRWHIQRGLRRVGWAVNVPLNKLRIRLEEAPDTTASIQFKVEKDMVRESFQWGRCREGCLSRVCFLHVASSGLVRALFIPIQISGATYLGPGSGTSPFGLGPGPKGEVPELPPGPKGWPQILGPPFRPSPQD